MKTLFLISLLVLSLFFVGCGGESEASDSSPSSDTTAVNKNFIMLYVAGSDLEERAQAATIDFNEIIVGYNQLSSAEQANLDILIAFGGARLSNWTGIRYATIECLIDDSKDGTYGNATCYNYENSSENMGSATALKDFLNFSSPTISTSNRSFLIFWNHGAAYKGVCIDSNKNNDILNIAELDAAMYDSGTKVDVIGMDACLMASIEVVKGVGDYCDYYLASEELEPGHGWDYEDVISIIGKGTNLSLNRVGTKLVDSYMDSSKHTLTKDKTLSFLNLSHSDDVINKIDALTQALDADSDFKAIGQSAYEAQKFGITRNSDDGRAMGIKSFSKNIGAQKSTLKSLSDDLNDAIDSLVVYSRGQNIDADGVTIYQPLNSQDWSNYNSISYTASPAWKNLLSSFTVTKGADLEEPKILSEESCVNGVQDGFCLSITDNVALKSVESYGLLPLGDDTMLLYTEILANDGDTYFLPKFNDEWFYICDGESQTQCIFPSSFEVELEGVNGKLYMSMGQYNSKDVTFLIQIEGSDVNMWAILDSDNSHASKQQYQVKKGDKIRFDYIIITSQGEIYIGEGDSLIFSNSPQWNKVDFNADIEYFALADDFNSNDAYSKSYFTQIDDTTPSSSHIDDSSSQSRLSYLEGKTATLNYDYYGKEYNEVITFSEAPQYDRDSGKYIIKGLRNNQDTIYCYSDEEEFDHVVISGVVYMYDCPSYFVNDAKDLFAFNINPDNTLSGYYEYVNIVDTALGLYNEMQDPDSQLVSSAIN